jgi:hypothetical protein
MPVYNPTGSGNVHIDQILTNISVAWPNNALVGTNLFPVVPVRKQSDKYYTFGREAWVVENDFRAPGTAANEITGYTLSTDTYYATEHSLAIPVPDEERWNADSPLSPDRDGTEIVTSKIWLGREKAMKDLVTTAANYATTNTVTLSGTTQWSDYVNSDPISDLRTGKSAVHARIFTEPNVGIFPYQVMTKLEDHPDFLERIKYSERGIVSADLIGAVVGIPKIIIPGVGIATTALGQPISVGYLWGKDVVLAWVPPRAGLKIPSFAYEFQWIGNPGGQGQYVDRWREEQRKSDLIRVCRYYDVKLVAQGDPGTSDAGKAIAGYLIKTAVA